MKGIIIVPIGGIASDILKRIVTALQKTFRCKAGIGREMPVPQDAYNPKRRQYHSTAILKKMRALETKDGDLMLGVTEVDIYVAPLNFVFGEADVFAGIAVISLARLRQEFAGLPPDARLLEERAVKEAVHEIGHTHGLDHCDDPRCIMYFSNSLRDTDRKGPGFCGVCREKLGIY